MTEPTYAAHIVDGVVDQVIVGTAQWATDNLGGTWVDSPDKVGSGWELVDGVIRPPASDPTWTYNGTDVVPPPAPEPDAQGDDLDDPA
jgi:hypothetical protein